MFVLVVDKLLVLTGQKKVAPPWICNPIWLLSRMRKTTCWRRSWKPTLTAWWKWRCTASKPCRSVSSSWCPVTRGADRACSALVYVSAATRGQMRMSGMFWWGSLSQSHDIEPPLPWISLLDFPISFRRMWRPALLLLWPAFSRTATTSLERTNCCKTWAITPRCFFSPYLLSLATNSVLVYSRRTFSRWSRPTKGNRWSCSCTTHRRMPAGRWWSHQTEPGVGRAGMCTRTKAPASFNSHSD